MKKIIIILLSCFLIASVASAGEQDEQDKDRAIGKREMRQEGHNRGEHGDRDGIQKRRRLERFQLKKLMEMLELTDENRQRFIELFKNYKREQMYLMDQRREVIDMLARMLRSGVEDESRLPVITDSLDNLDQQIHSGMSDLTEGSKKFMTQTQVAKLYVFHARFGNKVLGKMREFQMKQREKELLEKRIRQDSDGN